MNRRLPAATVAGPLLGAAARGIVSDGQLQYG